MKTIHLPSRQDGIATLIFSIAMVVLVIGSALYTSESIFLEQKISNNDVRAKHAFEAAEAGVAAANAYLSANPDRDEDGAIDAVFDTDDDDMEEYEEQLLLKRAASLRPALSLCCWDFGDVNLLGFSIAFSSQRNLD